MLEDMAEASYQDDSTLALPNGQHVSRATFDLVYLRLQESLSRMERETGTRPDAPDISSRVKIDSEPANLRSEPHAEILTGHYLGETKVGFFERRRWS